MSALFLCLLLWLECHAETKACIQFWAWTESVHPPPMEQHTQLLALLHRLERQCFLLQTIYSALNNATAVFRQWEVSWNKAIFFSPEIFEVGWKMIKPFILETQILKKWWMLVKFMLFRVLRTGGSIDESLNLIKKTHFWMQENPTTSGFLGWLGVERGRNQTCTPQKWTSHVWVLELILTP